MVKLTIVTDCAAVRDNRQTCERARVAARRHIASKLRPNVVFSAACIAIDRDCSRIAALGEFPVSAWGDRRIAANICNRFVGPLQDEPASIAIATATVASILFRSVSGFKDVNGV
jgi:hypothetical protein